MLVREWERCLISGNVGSTGSTVGVEEGLGKGVGRHPTIEVMTRERHVVRTTVGKMYCHRVVGRVEGFFVLNNVGKVSTLSLRVSPIH